MTAEATAGRPRGRLRDGRRHQRHADTRREILDLAWQLAGEVGLAGISLGEIARRMRMQTPSLYTYFPSKNAVFDAMFEEAARAHLERFEALTMPDDRRSALRLGCETFFDFCVENPPRYQLLFQRTIPGFEPSPEAYQPAVAALQLSVEQMRQAGLAEQRQIDLCIALCTGLVNQQLSNAPGDNRWRDLLDDAVDLVDATVTHQRGAR